MNKDCTYFSKYCINCQKSPIGKFTSPDGRFEHMHIDIVGPLKLSEGFRYVLTIVNRFTRWPEAIPLGNQTAEEVAKAFHINWVCRYGVAQRITTDQGRNFESELFHQLNQLIIWHLNVVWDIINTAGRIPQR
jgi:hypothetical protein